MSMTPLLKAICALRQISYDISSDLADDIFDVSKTTVPESLDHFCLAVQMCFGNTIRLNQLREILFVLKTDRSARICIGCLDYAGWEWKNVPKTCSVL